MLADHIRVDLAVALQQRIGHGEGHRGIVGEFRAFEIAGGIVFRRAGQEMIDPAKVRFHAAAWP